MKSRFTFVDKNLQERLSQICRRYGVKSLRVFGSDRLCNDGK